MHSKALARFWMLMGVKYAQKWTSQFTDDITLKIAQDEWARELSCLSMNEIKHGLSKCTDQCPDWPPTIGQFKLLCQFDADEYGLPNTRDAWSQACQSNKPFSHGVVLAAINDTACDVYNWRLLSFEKGLALFEPIYKKYLQRAINGEQFDLPMMVEDKTNRPVTWLERKQFARDHMSAMRAALKKGGHHG